MTEVRWLSPSEQDDWRALLHGSALLFERLDHELRTEHGISADDYEVLVQLSESPPGGLRMSVLADHALMSKSRLTYTVDRMERAGLLARLHCPEDGRGLRAVLTDLGWDKIRAAAVTHVTGVRRWFVDVVTADELRSMGAGFGRVRDRIDERDDG